MGFWNSCKHRLPKFPSSVAPSFRSACAALSPEEAEKLRGFVDENLANIKLNKEKNPSLDVKLAEQLTERCYYLLDRYAEFTPKQRAAVVGAIRYFAVGADAVSDTTFATGLDDDAKVMNHVLEIVGSEDRCLEII